MCIISIYQRKITFCRILRSIYDLQILTLLYKGGISLGEKEVDNMLLDDIDKLKLKLEKQIENNEPYEEIYKTSVEIDKLLVKYYSSLKDTKKDLNC